MERLKNKDSVVPIAGTVFQEIADVDSSTFASVYNVSVDSGDFVTSRVTANGQHFTEVSLDPLSASETQTVIEYKSPIKFPAYVEVECSVSQRTKGDFFVMELTDKDTSYIDLPTEYNIVASYTDNTGILYTTGQTATTLTVCLDAPFDGYLGSWVDIYGLIDNRFNYTNLNVGTISSDRKRLIFIYSDEVNIQSLTANPASVVGGKLKRQAKLMSAANAVGVRFSGTSGSALSLLSRFNGGSIKELGTLNGSRLITTSSTSPLYTNGLDGSVEITATSKFRLDVEPEEITLSDKVKDNGMAFTPRGSISAVKPNLGNDYYIRLRGFSPLSISRPVAKIVKAEKLTATTTATITTDLPHGLVTGNYVVIKGIRDQTNFANMTAPGNPITVLTATTFTVTCGVAAIATSYGGAVILCNGGVDQQGILGANIINIARDSLGFVTITGSASWSGHGGVGEYVNIYGVRDIVSGVNLGFDGVYRINNATGTAMRLEPVDAKNGYGNNLTPTGGVVASTACGGIVITRTTFRSHDVLLGSYNQTVTKLIGQGTARADLAVPVIMASSPTVSIGNAINATTGLAGIYVNPSNIQVVDIASTAITASANTTNILTTAGNAFQVNIQVTAIGGTTPTYDFVVEETYDGTNWITLYQFERIESTGSFNSPILTSMGLNIRYRQVIGGTNTPSFTRVVRRYSLPLANPKMVKRLIDRTVVLTTLNSVTEALFVDGTANAQLLVKIGTATTVPSLQLQGSEDNINWYDIGGDVQAVASGIASIIANNISAKFIRARVDVAGNTVVAGYVCLKAWA